MDIKGQRNEFYYNCEMQKAAIKHLCFKNEYHQVSELAVKLIES